MKKHLILFIILAAIPVLLAGCAHRGDMPAGSAPVVEKIWASPTAAWGENWRVYIKAQDPDGDLTEVRFNVEDSRYFQYGAYTFVRLPSDYRSGVNGYISIDLRNTPLELGRGVDLVVTVQLADAGGNATEWVRLPLTLSRTGQEAAPAGFDDKLVSTGPLWFLR